MRDLAVDGTRVTLQVDNDRLDALLQALTRAGVRTLTSRPPTLEELFLRHYTADAAEVPAGAAAGHGGTR